MPKYKHGDVFSFQIKGGKYMFGRILLDIKQYYYEFLKNLDLIWKGFIKSDIHLYKKDYL